MAENQKYEKEFYGLYESAAGSAYYNPAYSNFEMGDIFYDIISQYPEVEQIMIDLLRDEGPLLEGVASAEELPGSVELYYDKWFSTDERTDEELKQIALESIEGLKSLEYLIGNPTITRGMHMTSAWTLGQYAHGDPESLIPREYEDIPDTALVGSPTTWKYKDRKGMVTEQVFDEEDFTKTLIHEGLLHGMGIYHPNTPIYDMFVNSGFLPSLTENYQTASEDIYNLLSDSDKERLIYNLYPDHMREMKSFSTLPEDYE
jgi:hypothetical protein